MSIWKQPSKTGEGAWGDPNVTWGSDSVSWGAVLTQWIDKVKNTSTFTLQDKSGETIMPYSLSIGDGFLLSIDGTNSLLIQEGVVGAAWELQTKN